MTRPTVRPPRLPRLLVALVLRGEAREVVVGDLDEEFHECLARGETVGRARRHYWRQALATIDAIRRDRVPVIEQRHSAPHHDARGIATAFRGTIADLRYVSRSLRASPGFATVAILSLGIGIGANTAVFAMVRAVMLAPLRVDRPEDLVFVHWAEPADIKGFSGQNTSSFRDEGTGRSISTNLSYPAFAAIKTAVSGRTPIATFSYLRQFVVRIEDQPATFTGGLLVSGDFFATVRPGLSTGRALVADDDQPAAPRVAVISHHLWMRELGGRGDVVGSRLYVRDEPFVIVGVTAPGFRGLTNGGFFAPADVLFPLAAQPTVSPRAGPGGPSLFSATDRLWLRGIARVPATERAALEQVVTGTLRNALAATGRLDAAQIAGVSAVLTPAARGENGIRQQTEQPLEILAIIVGAVLAIACINVAGLLLARGLARQRELSVRRALGAARVQLMRLVVVEVLVLAVAGAVLGVAFAAWSGPLVMRLLTAGVGEVTVDASLDWTALAWTGGLVVAVMLLCAVLPAWRLTRAPRALDLRHRTIGASGTRLMLGRGLLALQIAITVPLLVGALLFVRTLHNLGGVEPGFDTRGLAMFSIPSSTPGRPVDVPPAVLGQLLARLEALPGVESATLVENALLSGWTSNASTTIAGQPARMAMNAVGPRFFETMGMALIAGRGPDMRDDASAPPVAVINQTAARKFFPGQSPIGQPIAQATRQLTIIGVVEDSKYDSLRSETRPTFFDSILQRPAGSAVRVVLRTSRVPASLEAGIRAAVTATSPSLAVADLKTQQDQIDEKTGTERLFARLLSAFAVFALLLACIGVHGATAYAVTRRTSEIGIRLALGAQRGSVVWLLLRQVFALALAGLAIGLPVAWWAGPLVRSLVFGLDTTDVVTLVAAAAATFLVALVAGFLPARRASHIDPINALRQD